MKKETKEAWEAGSSRKPVTKENYARSVKEAVEAISNAKGFFLVVNKDNARMQTIRASGSRESALATMAAVATALQGEALAPLHKLMQASGGQREELAYVSSRERAETA